MTTILVTPDYALIYRLVEEKNGKASLHQCRACDRQAERWVYDYSDDETLYGVRGDGKAVPYSQNLSAFVPLCDWHERKLYRLIKQYTEIVRGKV